MIRFCLPVAEKVSDLSLNEYITLATPNHNNASNVEFTVTFSELVKGVNTHTPFDGFILFDDGVINAFIVNVIRMSGTEYRVIANTGSGSGSIRLGIVYPSTLMDLASNTLPVQYFFISAPYDFNREPTVQSIILASANPTSAASVDFTVTFPEAVTGVDASDFSLTVTGDISGASVSAVAATGDQAVYTVTVDTGVGGGTLRLDVPITATIADLTGNPLVGLPYNSGEEYTILVTVPGAITDLAAVTGSTDGTVDLTWTAPADDVAVTNYLVRYSTSPITGEGSWWNNASPFPNSMVPQAAGQTETLTVTGLTPGQTYYFAVRARDVDYFLGDLSNVPSAVAKISPVGPGIYDDTHYTWTYNGTWSEYSGSGPYNSTLHYTSTAGAYAEITFTGTKVTLTYTQYVNRGSIKVYMDGVEVETFSANGSLTWQQKWTSAVYADGVHTVRFEHAGGGTYIDVDAITIE